MKTYLVTGGAGFIGSNYIRYLLKNSNEDTKVLNLDKLTYSGNPENLSDIEQDPRYRFVKGDIADENIVDRLFSEYRPDIVINFAAETHVDRSINRPDDFIRTDIYGTFVLLEAARRNGLYRYVQISTDEVYGHIPEGAASEDYPIMPTNPYSASKSGADRLCYSYYTTYNLPVIITRASNNFGPYQYPEKIIPLFITNAIENIPLPLYGDGMQIRDWLYVKDHCEAISFLLEKGKIGEVYNVGGGNLLANLHLTRSILSYLGKPESLIKTVTDRPGHDRRYCLNTEKIQELGWSPKTDFQPALEQTIEWYTNRDDWWKKIKTGEFKKYYEQQYRSG